MITRWQHSLICWIRDTVSAILRPDFRTPGSLFNSLIVLCCFPLSRSVAYRQNFAGFDCEAGMACRHFPLNEAMQTVAVLAVAILTLLSQHHSTEMVTAYQMVLWLTVIAMHVIWVSGYWNAESSLASELAYEPVIEVLRSPSLAVVSRDIAVPTPPPLLLRRTV